MLITKIIGAVFIISATTLYGYGLTKELDCRISTLKALKRTFSLLKSEIRYGVETLPDAFIHLSGRCSDTEAPVRDFFRTVGSRLKQEPQAELKVLWEEQALVLARDAHLSGGEADRLVQAAQCLGYLDIAQQMNNIDLYVENVDEDINALTEKYAGTCKMYTSLGVMAGLFLTILLI